MNSAALLQQALAALGSQRLDAAEAPLLQLLKGDPGDANAANLLGMVRRRQQRFAEAETLFRQALAALPEAGGIHNNLGNLLRNLGRNREAAQAYAQALRWEPRLLEARLNLAELRWDSGETERALDLVLQGLALGLDAGELHSLLGFILARGGRAGEALQAHRRALAKAGNSPRVWQNYGDSLLLIADIEGAITAFERCLALDPTMERAFSALLHAHQYLGRLTPAQLTDLHRAWAARFAPDYPAEPWTCSADPERKLKVAYLSPDLRDHSVATFLEPVLDAHDPDRFEIHALACQPAEDAVSERLKRRVRSWRNLHTTGADDAAELIRREGIDILVELAGHSAGSRLDIISLRPAPLQIFWLGYPGSTGVGAFQARFTDAVVDPPEDVPSGPETPLRLAGGFHAFRPNPEAPEPGPLPCLAGGGFTFGSFNSLQKHTPALLRLWAALLRRVPASRLLLKAHGLDDPSVRERLLELFGEEGIPASRITLLGHQLGRLDHLRLYREVDLALDTHPYNGVTTTCEALWMGVPVVTLAGDRPASREAASLLTQAGLTGFIARSANSYLEIAQHWAGQCEELAALRNGMRERLRNSPLLDGRALTREIEAGYRGLWRTWCDAQRAGG